MKSVILKPDREKSLLRQHPWVFSGAIGKVEGAPENGETVAVLSSQRQFLAWGAYSTHSQIQVRVWSWNQQDTIGPEFFRDRLEHAIRLRAVLGQKDDSNSVRLVHGESDGLPGLVVDRYDDTLVIQILSSGPERWRGVIIDLLDEICSPRNIYERSDVDVRRLEGLTEQTGLLKGAAFTGPLIIRENGLAFKVDVERGHKTGYYLDQRYNRSRIRALAGGRDVLDCFCYTGGFSAYALDGGASSVLAVDASSDALALARENLALNHLPLDRYEAQEADIFHRLRLYRDQGRSFDMIILDPPKFAQTVSQAERAARGYKDINLLAFKLLRPGGLLATFSCSGGISDDLFQKIVAGAALDAHVNAEIVERLHQGWDHPVNLAFPEGAYLKGLIVWVS